MNVEIWSDIACPWCYVGKALAGFEHRDEVTVTWRSFELDPSAPAARPGTRDEQLAEKYAPYRSTFDAHRLTHLAAAHGLQEEMEERLMRAHQSEGERTGAAAA